jgi:ankyrin repeat protein
MSEAAFNGNIREMKLLLQRGAKVTQEDRRHRTPLHFAAFNHQVDACRWLIQQGADVNAANNSNGFSPLFAACEMDDLEVVKVHALPGCPMHSYRAQVDAAAQGDRCAATQVLVESNADLTLKSREGHTPYHHAMRHNRTRTADYLREALEGRASGQGEGGGNPDSAADGAEPSAAGKSRDSPAPESHTEVRTV